LSIIGIFDSQETPIVFGQWLLKEHDRIQEQICEVDLKHEGHVTYGDNSKGRII